MSSFYNELKRRNVFRVAMAYAVVGWLVLQIADVLFPALGLPDWTVRLVIGFLFVGFPLALLFAWAYELTPEGLKREHEVDRDRSITHKTGRKLDFIAIGFLAAALVFFIVDKFVWQADVDAVTASHDKSIAVLPFVNVSDSAANEYFSDGITEELLNLLARVPGLRVIGRSSSFQFKDQNEDLRVIGEKLGVANLLEGSVRKSGNTVRVAAQLIDSASGSQLWSDTYDKNLDDIFKVQEEIAKSVVGALEVKLLGKSVAQRRAPQNSEAYDLYLKGKYFDRLLGQANLDKAADYYRQALALDPEFALAWAGLASVYSNQIMNGSIPAVEGEPLVQEANDQALALDANLVEAHYGNAFDQMAFDWDFRGAEELAKRALRISPHHAGALSLLGLISMARDRPLQAIDYQRRSLRTDPLRSASYHNLGFIYYQSGRYDPASDAFRTALELAGGTYTRGNYYLGLVRLALGDLDGARAELERESGEQWRLASRAVVACATGNDQQSVASLNELKTNYPDSAAFVIAEAHAYRGEIERAFEWLDRAYEQRDPLLPWIRSDPLLDNVKSDSRFRALISRLGLSD